MKFGILGAGFIAAVMADTLCRMAQQGETGAELYAVAARDIGRARAFAAEHNVPKAYGSYEEMLRDPAVEVVYIATPHSLHYRHIKLCADHGKHILCEKPFTVSARQAEDALRYAQARGVLVTEAIWTRYQPMRRIIREAVESGKIGEPRLLTANLGYEMTGKQRIILPELAGGALLDVGLYPLHFAEMVFGRPDEVRGLCTKNTHGVDMTDCITLTWKDGRVANLTAAANAVSDRYGVIYSTKGYLMVDNINNPQGLRMVDDTGRLIEEIACPPQLTGYEYEVRETVDCIRRGLPECPSMPHRETVHMMEQMDHLRAQMGIRYPCEETDDPA